MVADRITEPFRHDTDHGDRCAAQFHRGAHDVVAPLERALPHVISQHDDARRSRLLVGVEEPTTNQGSHTRGAKCGGRECRRPDQHGRCVADNQIPELRAVRPEAVDRPHIAPPFEEVPSDTELRLVRQGIVRLDDDDAIAVGQRDRGPQQFAHTGRTSPRRSRSQWRAPGLRQWSGPDISEASGRRACNPAACVLAVTAACVNGCASPAIQNS